MSALPMIHQHQVVLASASPRRAAIMDIAGIPYSVMESGAPENVDWEGDVDEAVIEAARQKAYAALGKLRAPQTSLPVIACDTVVVADGQVFGKPIDEEDARRMLHVLSGRTHAVKSGVCILFGELEKTFSETTKVTFWDLDDTTIDSYIASGEPFDKAGAYGIQGRGMLLVKGIEGDYCNVVGLPIARLARELAAIEED